MDKKINEKEQLIKRIIGLFYITFLFLFLIGGSIGKGNLTISEYRFTLILAIIGVIVMMLNLVSIYLKNCLNKESKIYKKLIELDSESVSKFFKLNLLYSILILILFYNLIYYLKNNIILLLILLYLLGEKLKEKSDYIMIGKLKYSVNVSLFILFILCILVLDKF